VSVAVEAGTGDLKDTLASLESLGVVVDDVGLRAPKLDEVFLALTGQPLDEEAPTASAVNS
jgi:ABC-2 type transport system ATP-binding protein